MCKLKKKVIIAFIFSIRRKILMSFELEKHFFEFIFLNLTVSVQKMSKGDQRPSKCLTAIQDTIDPRLMSPNASIRLGLIGTGIG